MAESIYKRVAEELNQQIASGVFKVEERLPSERCLSEGYKVSRMTIRQSLGYLEEKGIVYRQAGSGTYVKAPTFQQNNVKSFTETVGDLGFDVSTRVIEFSTIFTLEKVAKILNMPLSTEFYKMKRLRLGNTIPLALEVLYIPKLLCPKLELYSLSSSFYKLLEEVYSIKVSKVNYKMEAVIANPINSKIMELNKPTALLKVSGVTYDAHNAMIFYEESLYRSDLYHYQVDIHKKF
jgi:GntR family transcriptional regulator